MRRLVLVLLVALGLSPGLFWREDVPPPDFSQQVTVTPLAFPEGEEARVGGPGGPQLTGAWHLFSRNRDFGSYSALLANPDDTLLAISDRGRFLRMDMPGAGGDMPAELGEVLPGSGNFKPLQDMESATRDGASGRIWLGLESRHSIMRVEADFSNREIVRPGAMRRWPANGGAESLVRLGDGRFVVLAEGLALRRGRTSEGLLFPGDPIEAGQPVRFTFTAPPGYNPTDMALMPDGRVLILLRGFEFLPWPRFASALVLADPATIRSGQPWRWEFVAALDGAVPRENFEGLAVTGGADGGKATLWLISDDNHSRALQRSLLLRFEWQPPTQ